MSAMAPLRHRGRRGRAGLGHRGGRGDLRDLGALLRRSTRGDRGRPARVYSYDMVGSFVAIPIGQVIAGPIAQVAGREATLIGAAVLVTVSFVAMLSSRDVRTLRHQLPERAVEESFA